MNGFLYVDGFDTEEKFRHVLISTLKERIEEIVTYVYSFIPFPPFNIIYHLSFIIIATLLSIGIILIRTMLLFC